MTDADEERPAPKIGSGLLYLARTRPVDRVQFAVSSLLATVQASTEKETVVLSVADSGLSQPVSLRRTQNSSFGRSLPAMLLALA